MGKNPVTARTFWLASTNDLVYVGYEESVEDLVFMKYRFNHSFQWYSDACRSGPDTDGSI